MKTLLRLQELDLKIETIKAREVEIPKQKGKFDIYRKRLAVELMEREKVVKDLQLEQRACEGEIEQKQGQIKKYDQQLLGVKKNEEYQALLHEIDMLKKQIGLKEERILSIMLEMDEAKARLEEDKKRINAEVADIERQCAEVDAELAVAVHERKALESDRGPLAEKVEPGLLARYKRIRMSKKTGPAVVALNGEACSGCHMHATPQIVNEILAGDNLHACHYCGCLLYHPGNFNDDVESA